MSYERLNLQDFTDIWTAAHVTHVEDGIVNNETRLNTVVSNLNTTKNQVSTNTNKINEHTTQINTLNSDVEDLYESELINSIMPLWSTLLSYGGEKIFPPTISFDGNIIGKTYLSLGGDNTTSIGYVRIGDAVLSENVGVMTCGGLYHILLPGFTALGAIEQNVNINNITGLLSIFQYAMITGEYSYDYGDTPIVVYNSNYQKALNEVFGSDSERSELPTAFSINKNFEFNGIIYPSGFYSLYIFAKKFNDSPMHLPLFYVDKYWDLCIPMINPEMNMPLDYSKASNAFECFEDSIFWNGIDNLQSDLVIPLDHEFSGVKCISYNPQAFLEACAVATGITKNGMTLSVTSSDVQDGNLIYWLGDTIAIVPTLCSDNYQDIPSGVYTLEEEPFILQFHGIDTEKLFNKYKIDHQYLPTVPEFNLIDMGMPIIQLNGEPTIFEMNTYKLYFDSQKGPIKLTVQTELGQVSYLANFVSLGSYYQNVFSVYYEIEGSSVKFDVITVFNDSMISVQAIPVSQM